MQNRVGSQAMTGREGTKTPAARRLRWPDFARGERENSVARNSRAIARWNSASSCVLTCHSMTAQSDASAIEPNRPRRTVLPEPRGPVTITGFWE